LLSNAEAVEGTGSGPQASADKNSQGAAVKANPVATNAVTPHTATIGMYLFDLRNLNPAAGTFTCDFWIWSQSQDAANIISDLQFINAERMVWYVEGKPDAKGVNCYKRRGTGTFRTNWRLADYPFDAQKLVIAMEYSLRDSSKLILQPDTTNSGISDKNLPPDWKLTGFSIKPENVVFASNLGDPNLQAGHGDFSRLIATVDISRNNPAEFWGLTSTAYVAAILMLFSFFMDAELAGTRYALLGAAFLATVLSLKSTVSGLGEFGTRADQIHFIVIGFIFGALVCTLILNTLFHRKVNPHKIRIYSAFGGLVLFVAFILSNIILLRHHAVL
jgi:drug/metabolite transporter superfamily protein YnfA